MTGRWDRWCSERVTGAVSSSVIFAKTSVDDGLSTAASEIDKLAGQS